MRIDVAQISFIHPKLREVLLWLEEATGQEYLITSLHRIGDEGVHGTIPLRAADLRMRNVHIGYEIATVINETWQYDPARQEIGCAWCHGVASNFHLHVQVHDHTRMNPNA